MQFLLYFFGFIVFTSGLAWLATLAGLSPLYVNAGAALLMAIGIVTAILRARATEPA
jgi:hypothetical protein